MIKYLFIFICMLNLTFSNEIDSLFSAINRKDFDYVKANISRNINASDSYSGTTPLLVASYSGSLKIVEFLLNNWLGQAFL